MKRKGIKTYLDRDNLDYETYTLSFELRNEMWHELNRLIEKFEVQEDQVAIDLVNILRGHRDELGVDTPVDPITYEELMGYHLAFPPFFPNQKMFKSDDDFFVNVHKKYEHIDVDNIDNVIARRRAHFEEEMRLKKDRNVDVSYYDAAGWTTLPAPPLAFGWTIPDPVGLKSLVPYKTDEVQKINFGKTGGTFGRSGRNRDVACLLESYIHIDFTMSKLCLTSIGGAKLYLDNILKIDANEYHYNEQTDCCDVTEGVYKIDIEYYKLNKKSMLILTFGPPMRVVPRRSWSSVR